MQPKRIFQSALNNVVYVGRNAKPMTLREFHALTEGQQADLRALSNG